MPNNIDRAYELGNGLILNSDDGSPYMTGGLASPVGLDLPEETIYIQGTATGFVFWKHYNDNPNSWRIFDGTDIPFDPTGLLHVDGTDTNVFLALTKLASNSFSRTYGFEFFEKTALEQTLDNGFITYHLETSVNTLKAGDYIVFNICELSQSKKSTSVACRFRFRPTGGTWTVTSYFDDGIVIANRWKPLFSYTKITLPSDSTVDIWTEYGYTVDGGLGSIRNSRWIFWRIA